MASIKFRFQKERVQEEINKNPWGQCFCFPLKNLKIELFVEKFFFSICLYDHLEKLNCGKEKIRFSQYLIPLNIRYSNIRSKLKSNKGTVFVYKILWYYRFFLLYYGIENLNFIAGSKDGWIKRVKDQLKKEGWTNEDLSPSSRKIWLRKHDEWRRRILEEELNGILII